jgi:predicted alpha/beta superfamily hydrolase
MGYVHIIRAFESPEGAPRTIRIYTPDAYDWEPERRFGVLYMQDGQNVFAHADSALYDTWCANWAIEQVAAEGATEPWIIVGVDHGVDRFGEYSPWDEPRLGIHGRGQAYVAFVADRLRPFIESNYRTKTGPEWTGIMGSSLGGLVSLYAAWSRPEIFGRIGGVSPTVMWSLGKLFDVWKEHTHHWSRIYLDVGAQERIYQQHVPLDYADFVVKLYDQLKAAGYADHELRLVVDPDGVHHETSWQRRLPDAFRWLLAG